VIAKQSAEDRSMHYEQDLFYRFVPLQRWSFQWWWCKPSPLRLMTRVRTCIDLNYLCKCVLE